MFRRVIIFLFFSIFLFSQISSAEKVWQEINSGIINLDIHSISVFPKDDNFICTASSRHLYFSENRGNFWQEIFSFKAEEAEINFIAFDSSNPKIIYLATTEGLLATKNQGKAWQKIFRRVSETTNNVTWIAQDRRDYQKIYLGTGDGLYLSQDLGETWMKVGGGLPRSCVRSIAVHPYNSQVLYIANTYGLFKSIDSGQFWKRIYVTSYRVSDEENDENEENQDDQQINQEQNLINCIAIDKRNPKRIFIATGQGVFFSPVAGETWNKLSTQGLSCDDVNFIVVSDKKDAVYAATENGVFEFLPELNNWQEIYQGMTAREVCSLAFNMDGRQLFAGTERGVFRTTDLKIIQKPKEVQGVVSSRTEAKETTVRPMVKISNQVKIDEKTKKDLLEEKMDVEQILEEISLNEPTIREVQETALRYAEVVHPANIKSLRRNARLKALLPDISIDYDKTIQAGGTGSHFGDFIIGPRDWGLSFSWDVGDLVYSEQVRLIDSNARLMVQLRDNILNEVTRLYYERRKLQTELILTPPKSPEDKLTKALRLEELTANIDALTGSYFSRQLKRKGIR